MEKRDVFFESLLALPTRWRIRHTTGREQGGSGLVTQDEHGRDRTLTARKNAGFRVSVRTRQQFSGGCKPRTPRTRDPARKVESENRRAVRWLNRAYARERSRVVVQIEEPEDWVAWRKRKAKQLFGEESSVGARAQIRDRIRWIDFGADAVKLIGTKKWALHRCNRVVDAILRAGVDWQGMSDRELGDWIRSYRGWDKGTPVEGSAEVAREQTVPLEIARQGKDYVATRLTSGGALVGSSSVAPGSTPELQAWAPRVEKTGPRDVVESVSVNPRQSYNPRTTPGLSLFRQMALEGEFKFPDGFQFANGDQMVDGKRVEKTYTDEELARKAARLERRRLRNEYLASRLEDM